MSQPATLLKDIIVNASKSGFKMGALTLAARMSQRLSPYIDAEIMSGDLVTPMDIIAIIVEEIKDFDGDAEWNKLAETGGLTDEESENK